MLEQVDFYFERIVFFHLAFQKALRELSLFCNPAWGEKVGVVWLLGAGTKIFHLHHAFVQQGFQAEVGFSQAEPQRFSEFAMVDVGSGFEHAQNLEVRFFVQRKVFGLACRSPLG